MPDNVTLNLGTGGDSIAADDVAGVKHQRVKIEWGADGTVNEVDDTLTNRLPVKTPTSATATPTSVSDTNASTTLLAANSNRVGATIYNDSSALLYVLLGSGTASSTSYTVRVYSNGYYETPQYYTGQINGIWASDPNDGAARITELT